MSTGSGCRIKSGIMTRGLVTRQARLGSAKKLGEKERFSKFSAKRYIETSTIPHGGWDKKPHLLVNTSVVLYVKSMSGDYWQGPFLWNFGSLATDSLTPEPKGIVTIRWPFTWHRGRGNLHYYRYEIPRYAFSLRHGKRFHSFLLPANT